MIENAIEKKRRKNVQILQSAAHSGINSVAPNTDLTVSSLATVQRHISVAPNMTFVRQRDFADNGNTNEESTVLTDCTGNMCNDV